jgi:Bacteriophage minor capsid protein
MNLSPAEVVRYMLIQFSLGVDSSSTKIPPKWSTFVNVEPDIPDYCISVYDRQSVQEGRLMVTGAMVDKEGIQVRVRTPTITEGRIRTNQIRDLISKTIRLTTINCGTTQVLIHSCCDIGGILYNGKEQSTNRDVHTLNFFLKAKEV